MDVQSVTQAPPLPSAVPASNPALEAPPAPLGPAKASSGSDGKQAPALPGHDGEPQTTLDRTIQKLFAPGVANVGVSFKVVHNPNEIVTVFRNVDTGEEIAQFPAEIMVQIAQFFQKIAGAVLDRSA